MIKTIIFVSLLMLTFSVVDARVLPTTVQFQYPMELDPLKGSGKFVKISSSELKKTYDDYTIGVNENGFMVTCNDVDVNCLDEDVFRKILEEMESFGAYDLSKEDKDVIANLYKPNVIVKNIPKKNVFGISLKTKILEFLGQIFCTHYEIIQECKGDWCSLKEYTSEECAGLE